MRSGEKRMQQLAGRVAVVTGAGSGIGRALAERFAREEMRLVLVDVEAEALAAVAQPLRSAGAEVEDGVLDVRDRAALTALADRAASRFGGVHVLCNNAGVATGGAVWDVAPDDWDWVVGVNLMGVINGIHAFVPGMVAQGGEGHVVNTASIAGLTCPAFMSPYNVTKHAVVALSETLRADLHAAGANIGVSVLCPGWVQTRIHESDRNKPGGPKEDPTDPVLAAMRELVGGMIAGGIDPASVADHVVNAIRANDFWIRTHRDMEPLVAERCQAIRSGEAPPLMVPTDIK
jgi:NAD(P)-dependent dehydrogenase (short-subunit alcohol dehydrogenase family)